jgi:hypothetical protein
MVNEIDEPIIASAYKLGQFILTKLSLAIFYQAIEKIAELSAITNSLHQRNCNRVRGL